ncbi:hypothetical protein EUTSA_v10010711mg [Eutrema salsugineum]|uniref:Uncharacterized protein n=1 Tax=Eutrema salsugineum TaxID=72664 RepID=V4LZA9_EUTSA|nr:uncharacterized protein LOC18020850 [Eutrema salsugineum]ESQ45253.1 hypothetical protein EUTSA_v10010711mg [Eutrema salsugineum]
MGLSQTATILVAVFVFCLIAVTAQLAYVLWWKRRFRRRSIAGSELDAFSSRGGDPTATPPPSKELLYFFLFCLENKQFRIGSATAPPLPPAAPPMDDVASKWSTTGENLLCGPSETLFTIAEDCTSETDHNHRTAEIERRGSVSMDDHHVKDEELEDGFVVRERNDDEVDSCDYDHHDDGTTPFSTPCGSPPFYTPSPSPVRDEIPKKLGQESLYG